MRAWIVQRRQEVVTGDHVQAEQIRERIAELEGERRLEELRSPDVFAVVVRDELTIQPVETRYGIPMQLGPQVEVTSSVAKAQAEDDSTPTPASRYAHFPCPAKGCGYVAVGRAGLMSHYRARHPDAPPIGQLEPVHPDSAAALKTIQCPRCPASFMVLGVFERHLAREHPTDLARARREAGLA